MFSDTITFTINAVAKVLTRINQDGYSSEYLLRETAGEYRAKLRNSTYKSKDKSVTTDRHNLELVHTIYPVAPATSPTIRKTYVVFENDAGDALVDNAKTSLSVMAFLTEANITKLLNFES
nr:MAG: hypothetical protein 2 [Leviviridae sp.]